MALFAFSQRSDSVFGPVSTAASQLSKRGETGTIQHGRGDEPYASGRRKTTSCTPNYRTFWYRIKPKFAETALLFYSVTDVPVLPKWTNEPRLVLGIDLEENVALGMGM